MTHADMTFGEDHDGRCLKCGSETEIVTVPQWKTHPEDGEDEFVEPEGEVSGHWCRNCDRLTAVFLNSL